MINLKFVIFFIVIIYFEFFVTFSDSLNANDTAACVKLVRKTVTRNVPIKNCRRQPCYKKEMKTIYKNITTCCDGWYYELLSDSCRPLCKLGCSNGTCIKPGLCQCEPPLVLVAKHRCVLPTCNPPCGSNRRCTNIDTCTCDPGYNMTDNNTCSPICNPSCENAYCVAPNKCECLHGYSYISDSKCAPKCDKCEHGDCIAPENCKCHKFYEKRDGVCAPICDQPCTNGICSKPNTCKCNAGYDLGPENKFNCLPICEPQCSNASCVSPNTCRCHIGYQMTGNNWTCKPKCSDCENGECVAPNNCICSTGYLMVGGKCRPICEVPCKNGFCSRPNVCSCETGYKIDERNKFICQPICKNECINSTCVAPGKCQCKNGYESTERDHICKPKCASCVHGKCVAPDVCKCDDGYNMTKGVCAPICSSSCVNGFCSSPENCSCEDGFRKKSIEQHVCYKECSGPCLHGVCTLQGICICDRGYELVNGTCVVIKSVPCKECEQNCTDAECFECIDGRPCTSETMIPSDLTTSTSLAGLELTWVLAAAVGLLLVILVIAVIFKMSHKKYHYEDKTENNGDMFSSVVYTLPDTLLTRHREENDIQLGSFREECTRLDKDENTRDSLLEKNDDHIYEN